MKKAKLTKNNEYKIDFKEVVTEKQALPLHAQFWTIEFLAKNNDSKSTINSNLFHTTQLMTCTYYKPINCFFKINPLCHDSTKHSNKVI